MKMIFRFGIVLSFLAFASALVGATYYVGPSGNDTNSGLLPTAAWKTINRANTQSLGAGDQLLFQSSAIFAGTIYLGPTEGGTSANPVLISSYGASRATINGGNTNAVFAYNCGGIIVSNLNFIGSGWDTNQNSGVEFYNDGDGAAQMLDFIRVSDVDVSGFGYAGVAVGGWYGTNAYRDVRVNRIDTHDNGNAGIHFYAEHPNLNTNVYVGYCRAWNNPGRIDLPEYTGYGIALNNVNNALLERCAVWNNGWNGEAAFGVGCYDSTRATIQFCESYANYTGGSFDGGGFAFGGGVTFSTLQYNYSHDNDGAGYAIYEYPGAPPSSNNVVRFNISENDGWTNACSAMQLWNGGGRVRDVDIYNNTIFISPSVGTTRAVYFESAFTNAHFRNNLFVTTGGAQLIEGPSDQSGVLFQGNDYWSSGDTFAIQWGSTTYNTLATWRTASQEKIGTTNVGFSVDPQLMNPGYGGTIGDVTLLPYLTAYQLNTWSPMREAGLDLTGLFGLNPGPQDFYGNSVPNGLALDIGAHDARLDVLLSSPRIEAGYFTATYQRGSPARADLNYRAELSGDFNNWCTNCVVPVQTNSVGDGSEVVKLRESTPASGSPARFLRMRLRRL
jgi:hypothetical protein